MSFREYDTNNVTYQVFRIQVKLTKKHIYKLNDFIIYFLKNFKSQIKRSKTKQDWEKHGGGLNKNDKIHKFGNEKTWIAEEIQSFILFKVKQS